MIARWGTAELIDAGRDQSPQRSGQLRHRAARGSEGGQLDEEQRVAAAAVDEPGDGPLARLVTIAAFEDPAHELGGIVDAERAEWHLEDERTLDRRRPHAVGIGPLPRDRAGTAGPRASATITASWSRRAGIGPLQVVDPQHRHPGLGVAAQHVGQRHGDGVASPGGVEPVERRRVSEQVGDHVEVAAQLGVAGLQSPQLARRGPRRCARHRSGWRRGRGGTASTARSIDRRQHVGLAVRARRPCARRSPHPPARSMISSASRDLPAPASPMIDTIPLWPLRTSCTAASSRRPLVGPPDERARRSCTGRAAGGRGAGDQPGVLVLLPTPDAGDRRTARARWPGEHSAAVAEPDEHAARRSQRLQPRAAVLTTSPIAV